MPPKTDNFGWSYEADLEVHGLTMSPDGNTLSVLITSDSFFAPHEVPLFFVVDISDVNQPQEIAEVQNTSLSASLPVHCLSPDGNTLFVAGDNSPGACLRLMANVLLVRTMYQTHPRQLKCGGMK